MGKKFQKILWAGVFLCGLWFSSSSVLAEELTVLAGSAIVRAEASTGSDIVNSFAQGTKLTSEDQTTDSSGQLWYKVALGGNNYGYIRSDLVEVSGESDSSNNAPVVASNETTDATAIEERLATISQSSVNIRGGASTSHRVVVSLPSGTEITLIGEATDDDGDKWYQMKVTADGEEITGFVREDMIEVGELVAPPPEEIIPEVTDPATPDGSDIPVVDTQMDYFITHEQNDQGGYDYYLNDRIKNVKSKIDDLYSFTDQAEQREEVFRTDINGKKTIIIILAVIIVVLVIVLTLMVFKIRDLYDDIDDSQHSRSDERRHRGGFEDAFRKSAIPDDNRRNERRSNGPAGGRPVGQSSGGRRPGEPSKGSRPGEPSAGGRRPGEASSDARRTGDQSGPRRSGEPVDQNRRPADGSSGAPRKAGEPHSSQGRRSNEQSQRPGGAPVSQSGGRPLPERENQRSKRPGSPELRATERANERTAPARKPQNFLNDDDEFEFEFLNIDDKE
ncbi:MAG: SH3 domain-containing protein [Lachnospiraceae bacterium]|nr:SH3 domain-containing protein [Lachnospiraceae bacterium]